MRLSIGLCAISAFERWLMLQESRTVAEKPHDAVVKFDTYRNLQRRRAALSARTALVPYRQYTIFMVEINMYVWPFNAEAHTPLLFRLSARNVRT